MLVKHQRFDGGESAPEGGSGFPGIGERGLIGGGSIWAGAGSNINEIDYITIATLGDASDFGNLIQPREQHASCAGGGRGVFIAGFEQSGSPSNVIRIDYVTIATTGDASDFGDVLGTSWGITACSDGTRGVHGEGQAGSAWPTTELHYITLATASNSTSFGVSLPLVATGSNSGYSGPNCPNFVQQPDNSPEKMSAMADATRGVFGKGTATSYDFGGMAIDYVTIATTGTATFFGLNVQRCHNGAQNPGGSSYYNYGPYGSGYLGTGTSDGSRGIFAGGYGYANMGGYNFCGLTGGQNFIEYLTIATTGNAADFGDLTIGRMGLAGFNNATRSVFSGGTTDGWAGGRQNRIDYITTQTTGDATDFGDLVQSKWAVAGCSGD